MAEPLTSTRNPRVRAAAALSRRRERRATGTHLVEGPRAVGEALRHAEVRELFATAEALPRPLPAGVVAHEVAAHVLEALADARTPQGIVAVVATPQPPVEVLVGAQLVVVLDGVADPGNVGTILRTADAAGADAVVVTAGSADPFGPKAVRAAVGSTYHLPVIGEVTLADAVAVLRADGHQVLGLDAGGRRTIHDLAATDGPLTLVVGSEAHGLRSPELLDGSLAVPIAARAESLNAAAAAAVAVFAASHALGRVAER